MTRKARAVAIADNQDWRDDGPGRMRGLMARLSLPVKDLVVLVMAVAAASIILINALFLQTGQHPAPLFSTIIPTPTSSLEDASIAPVLPRPRPVEMTPAKTGEPVKTEPARIEPVKVEPAPAQPRTRGELVSSIQKELSQRGFYDGTIDGFYGPKTDAAIRDFEQAAKLKPSAEPNEILLASIVRSNVTGQKSSQSAAAKPVRQDPLADLISPPANRVIAVQRALSEWGYGQLKPSGQVDGDTQAAIEKFERDRKLPVTGQMSDRLLRELTAVTGRPLE